MKAAHPTLLAVFGLVLTACRHEPTDTERGVGVFQQGYMAMQEARYDDALRYFTTAERLIPGDAYVQLDLGVTLVHLGRRDEARAAFERAMELGREVKSITVTDPIYAGRTVAQLAADNIAGMDRADAAPAASGGAAQH